MLKQDHIIQSQLVLMGWRFGQSYNGGHLAGQMVMSTLGNRVRAGWGPWLKVIEGVPEFMAESVLPTLVYPGIWEPAFVKLLHAVEGVFDGSAQDLSHGALYWGDLGRIQRDWFKTRIIQARSDMGLPLHARVADMNSLSFWR